MESVLDSGLVDAIWQRADDEGIDVNRTNDEWGNPITIFQGWDDVEKIGQIGYSIIPPEIARDYAPTFVDRGNKYVPNPLHHIEWMIGEFGFDDQYITCSQCYCAIDTHDYQSAPHYNLDLGEIYCRDCLRTNAGDSATAYLEYVAAHLEDNGEIASTILEPQEYGYIPINPYSAYGEYYYGDFLIKYEGISPFPDNDHEEIRGSFVLDYPNHEEIKRLGKSARLIDPNLKVIAQYAPHGRSTYLFWAKFEDEPIDGATDDDKATNYAILQYTIGLVLKKYQALRK